MSRKTVKQLAGILGFNETQVALYALAKLREELIPAYPHTDPRALTLADQQAVAPLPHAHGALGWGHPRIEDACASSREVSYVSRNYRHAVHEGGASNNSTHDRARVRHV